MENRRGRAAVKTGSLARASVVMGCSISGGLLQTNEGRAM
jgi:hypothetical protein